MIKVFRCDFLEPITIHSGETLRVNFRIEYDKNGDPVKMRVHKAEVVERPETKQVINYDD